MAAPPIAVVLCDDVPQLRTLLRIALDQHDDLRVVAETGDGVAALAAVREHRPDALLLDLAMPGLDGLAALPRLRAEAPGLAILVFSGFESTMAAEDALAAGADAYLEKGAPLDEVAEAVRAAVARRRA